MKEVCEELNLLGFRTRMGKTCQHPRRIVKSLRSLGKG